MFFQYFLPSYCKIATENSIKKCKDKRKVNKENLPATADASPCALSVTPPSSFQR